MRHPTTPSNAAHRIAFAAILGLSAMAGCGDPLQDRRISNLGAEQDGFAPNAFHRPGQPCLVCHSPGGPGEGNFSIGGTLFYVPEEGVPVLAEGYTVRLTDSKTQTREVVSNPCGNFHILRDDWDPFFPIRAEIWGPLLDNGDPRMPILDEDDKPRQTLIRPMITRIGRDGSCGSCHKFPTSPFSPGVVFVPVADEKDIVGPSTPCPAPTFLPEILEE